VVILGFIVGALVAVFGVAILFDLRARRHRGLSADFKESGRLSERRRAESARSGEARHRPTKMGGRGGPRRGSPGP
jgi:hypothetical protein